MAKTYTNRSNANRAAKRELAKAPEGTTVELMQVGGAWSFALIEPTPAAETACTQPAETATNSDTDTATQSKDETMNDTTATPAAEEVAPADLLAQAESALAQAETNVTNAEAAVPAAVEAEKAAKAAVKESTKNLKDAKAYAASLGDDASDEDKAAAQESLDGWTAADAERKAAATAATAAVKAARATLKEAKAARTEAKKAVTAAKKVKAPKAERVVQNGQPLPAEGTIGATIWAAADKASAAKGEPAALGDIQAELEAAGVKTASVRAGYSHWRKFHGITGRVMSTEAKAAKEAKEQAAAEAKAAKEAEKAAKAAAEATPTPAPAPAPEAE